MRTEAIAADATRHRLLEGVLLRLARQPDAGGFVLRGGLLLRHWFRPVPRPAEDLDLVAAFPCDVGEAARRILPVLADGADDGVTFDPDGARVQGIFLDTGSPGARVFATGQADGVEADFHIDVTFGPPPRPAPVLDALPTACGATARVWVCRSEAVVGQKVQALCHLGMMSWRAKDLNDLRLLLDRVPVEDAALGPAVAAYLADLGRPAGDARTVFGPDSWWGLKRSSARWLDFVHASPDPAMPRELAAVVAGIADRLNPVLEGLP